jgi:hypothetical protein
MAWQNCKRIFRRASPNCGLDNTNGACLVSDSLVLSCNSSRKRFPEAFMLKPIISGIFIKDSHSPLWVFIYTNLAMPKLENGQAPRPFRRIRIYIPQNQVVRAQGGKLTDDQLIGELDLNEEVYVTTQE